MNIKLVITFFLIGFIAQSQIVTGKINDVFSNGIENAYIVNSNSQSHAHSDELGNFSLDKTVIGDDLIITSLGFKKNKIKVTSSNIIIVLEKDIFKLDEVVISSKLTSLNIVSKIDLQTNPVNSSQEILRKVPGLFIGQHAGGGKAEQLFLRGFDIDHGTDIAITVDDIPVNMVSHAHGQGYADLHFAIPETIEKIDFGKGTYYANKGDFATAGYVSFATKENLEKSQIGLEIGQFNTKRIVSLLNLIENKKNQNAYLATEYVTTDGPFESPQNFKRINLFGKYTTVFANNSKLIMSASSFSSKWDASGQIPQKLVTANLISRFGSVDDTEGGATSRSNLNVSLIKPINENLFIKSNVFYSKYDFELFSNFTFFLNDPINGDQIKQKENRTIYGFNTEINSKNLSKNSNYQLGLGFREDQTINSELSHTKNRNEILNQIKLGDIDQNNMFGYANANFDFGNFRINPAVRLDYFKFNYQDKLQINYKTQSETKVKVSPKFNVSFSPNNNFQLYIKSGLGFHSNDTRVVVNKSAQNILPTATGIDFGTVFKPIPKLIVSSALWYLGLQQEFVYVGDEGVVEPSGRSKRMGIDFGVRYQLSNVIFYNLDANYTHARSIDNPSGQNYIPLAPDFTLTSGLSISKYKGFSGGINYRYLKSRPANEDNSIVAKGYMVSDFNANYELKSIIFGLSADNVFNTKWNETQFATTSQLQNESQSTEEIHFTPGTPFFLKAKITYKF